MFIYTTSRTSQVISAYKRRGQWVEKRLLVESQRVLSSSQEEQIVRSPAEVGARGEKKISWATPNLWPMTFQPHRGAIRAKFEKWLGEIGVLYQQPALINW